jgi:hypothetical protein
MASSPSLMQKLRRKISKRRTYEVQSGSAATGSGVRLNKYDRMSSSYGGYDHMNGNVRHLMFDDNPANSSPSHVISRRRDGSQREDTHIRFQRGVFVRRSMGSVPNGGGGGAIEHNPVCNSFRQSVCPNGYVDPRPEFTTSTTPVSSPYKAATLDRHSYKTRAEPETQARRGSDPKRNPPVADNMSSTMETVRAAPGPPFLRPRRHIKDPLPEISGNINKSKPSSTLPRHTGNLGKQVNNVRHSELNANEKNNLRLDNADKIRMIDDEADNSGYSLVGDPSLTPSPVSPVSIESNLKSRSTSDSSGDTYMKSRSESESSADSKERESPIKDDNIGGKFYQCQLQQQSGGYVHIQSGARPKSDIGTIEEHSQDEKTDQNKNNKSPPQLNTNVLRPRHDKKPNVIRKSGSPVAPPRTKKPLPQPNQNDVKVTAKVETTLPDVNESPPPLPPKKSKLPKGNQIPVECEVHVSDPTREDVDEIYKKIPMLKPMSAEKKDKYGQRPKVNRKHDYRGRPKSTSEAESSSDEQTISKQVEYKRRTVSLSDSKDKMTTFKPLLPRRTASVSECDTKKSGKTSVTVRPRSVSEADSSSDENPVFKRSEAIPIPFVKKESDYGIEDIEEIGPTPEVMSTYTDHAKLMTGDSPEKVDNVNEENAKKDTETEKPKDVTPPEVSPVQITITVANENEPLDDTYEVARKLVDNVDIRKDMPVMKMTDSIIEETEEDILDNLDDTDGGFTEVELKEIMSPPKVAPTLPNRVYKEESDSPQPSPKPVEEDPDAIVEAPEELTHEMLMRQYAQESTYKAAESPKPKVDGEPTHMTMEEVWKEARTRGIPLAKPQVVSSPPLQRGPVPPMRSKSYEAPLESPKKKFKDKFKFPNISLFKKDDTKKHGGPPVVYKRGLSHPGTSSTPPVTGRHTRTLPSSGHSRSHSYSSQTLSTHSRQSHRMSQLSVSSDASVGEFSLHSSPGRLTSGADISDNSSQMALSIHSCCTEGSASMWDSTGPDGVWQHSNADFIESLRKLKDCGWYWGPLNWNAAEQKLSNKPDGSFLVRDSSDDRYILSLSFRSQCMTHHTRIEHYKGTFSFYSQPKSHGAGTIIEFIEKAMEHSRSGKFLYFLRPRAPGMAPAPVQLLFPISRLRMLQSLQHMSRFIILKHVRYDHIECLPLPSKMITYLKESQYYVEYILDEGNGEFLEQ